MEITGYKCDSCDELFDSLDDAVVLYECPECSTVFSSANSYTGDGHQCPNDRKFSSKTTENGCSECRGGELIETLIYQCETCNELFELEDDLKTHEADEHGDGETEDDEEVVA